MRTVFVVTHPEATHHVDGVVGGWHDSVLTANGERDAGLIASALRDVIPPGGEVELYTSDLQRATGTAAVIGERFHVTPVLEARLREKSYGDAEGRPQGWLDDRFIAPPESGDRMHHDEGIEGAETKAAFARRVYEAMDAIVAADCEYQIVVTHGFALTFVVAAWIKMPIEAVGYVNFSGGSGSITTLREDDFFHNRHVGPLACTRHLNRS